MLRNKIKYLFTTIILSLLTANLVACANGKNITKDQTIIEKIKTLTKNTPESLKDIENIIDFQFEDNLQSQNFNTATASTQSLSKTNLKYIEYRYRFQKDNPLGLLIIKLKNLICISKKEIINNFEKPVDKYIPKVHFWSGNKEAAPYKNVAEYYIYKINNKKLSVGFLVDTKTGLPQDSACVSGFTIDYDEYRTQPPTALSK